jgi:hypothetical protein
LSDCPIAIVYGPTKRDLHPLEKAAKVLGFPLEIIEDEKNLQIILNQKVISCIIVPFTSDDIGCEKISTFANATSKMFLPEHADIILIYSTEDVTPDEWIDGLDPRPIKRFDDELHQIFGDSGWRHTIKELEISLRRINYKTHSVGNSLKIEFEDFKDVPFPTQASFLMRAAFKDMSKILIKFPTQGLSGSIACVVEPFDSSGTECKQLFVKVYPDDRKAQKENSNFILLKPYIEAINYPEYDDLRRYRGQGYSLMVSDLTKGPSGKLTTFGEIILNTIYSKEFVRTFLEGLLLIHKKLPRRKYDFNLWDEYIVKYFNEKMYKVIDSYNQVHRWFGAFADATPIKEKIRKTLPEAALTGTTFGMCHGDFHYDNIMLRDIDGKIVPVFIDFARAGWTHSVKDFVILETDLIIRGLKDQETLSQQDNILKFLDNLHKNDTKERGKVNLVINLLRKGAFESYGATEIEYYGAALLKTLEVLSYGKLPFDQNERATTYVTYLLERLSAAS